MLKTKLLNYFYDNKNTLISGQELADMFSVSRNAVWKAILSLKSQGFDIENINRKGYIYRSFTNEVSIPAIKSKLEFDIPIKLFDTVTSTNTLALNQLSTVATNGSTLIALEQTQGRGRRGKHFSSLKDSGIYMSIILDNPVSSDKTHFITAAAAVAICDAIFIETGIECKVKWVNDIFINNKKVCGILTEGITNFETGNVEKLVVGIGINICNDKIPIELKNIAIGLDSIANKPVDKNSLIAKIIKNTMDICVEMSKSNFSFMKTYQSLSLLDGKAVTVHETSGKQYTAIAKHITSEGELSIELSNGEIKYLQNGEISIKF